MIVVSGPTRPVIGLDPSLTGFGICAIHETTANGGPVINVDTLKTSGARKDTLETRQRRLAALEEQAMAWVPPNALVVIEGPAYSKGNSGTWDRAGLWWAIIRRLSYWDGIDVVLCPPNIRAKYATGRGNAGKLDVMAAVIKRYPTLEFRNDNETDAFVLASMGRRLLDAPVEGALPVPRLSAMGALEVPEKLRMVVAS